ncbi:MAG: glycosyltransferase family 4 protein [bacterium]|nr:glycosyltransferase family 4 protein [bacterium]
MRVLVTATTFPRWKDDTEPAFVFNLSNHLADRFKILALVPHAPLAKKHEKIEDVNIKRFQYFVPASKQKLCYGGGILPNMKKSFLAKIQVPFLFISEFFAVLFAVKKGKIDLIHAHWLVPQGVVAALVKKFSRAKVIVSIHGSDIHPFKSSLFRKMQRFVLKNADFVTVNSNTTKEEMKSRFPEFDYNIIPMGIELNNFKGKTPHDGINILCVGRLSEQKGIQYLMRAMPYVTKSFPDAKLTIVGEGPYKKELMKIKGQIESKNIIFTGALNQTELLKRYSSADVFVLPSISDARLGKEGQGLVLLEAMAAKIPCIAAATGGIKDTIEDKKNGLLVPQKSPHSIASALITLLSDKKLQETLTENGAITVRNYSWDKIANRFANLYEKCQNK